MTHGHRSIVSRILIMCLIITTLPDKAFANSYENAIKRAGQTVQSAAYQRLEPLEPLEPPELLDDRYKLLRVSGNLDKKEITKTQLSDDTMRGTIPINPAFGVQTVAGTAYQTYDNKYTIEFNLANTQHVGLALYKLSDSHKVYDQTAGTGAINQTTHTDNQTLRAYYDGISPKTPMSTYEYQNKANDATDPLEGAKLLGWIVGEVVGEQSGEVVINDKIFPGYNGMLPYYKGEDENFYEINKPTTAYGANQTEDKYNTVIWNGKIENEHGERGYPKISDAGGDLASQEHARADCMIVVVPRGRPAEVRSDEVLSDNSLKYPKSEKIERLQYSAAFKIFAGLIIDYDKIPDEMRGMKVVDDPVNVVSGNFTWEYSDLRILGGNALNFTRYYNTQNYVKSAMGRGWRHNFDYFLIDDPHTKTVLLPSGEQASFIVDATGNIAQNIDRVYNLSGTSGRYQLKHKDGTTYNFDGQNKLSSIEKDQKTLYRLTYAQDKLVRVDNALGNSYLEYNYTGDILTSVFDSAGRSVQFSYDGQGNLASAKNPDNDTMKHTYDNNNLMSEIYNYRGQIIIKNQFDTNMRVKSQWISGRGTATISYDALNRVNTHTETNGRVTKYYYDERGKVTKTEQTDASNQNITYDAFGNKIKESDYLNNQTTYDYDAHFNVTAAHFADGTTTTYEYKDARYVGLPTKILYADGSFSQFSYDNAGNLINYRDKNGVVTTNSYDNRGNLTSKTTPIGTTSYTYDQNGNLLTTTDQTGSVTTNEYDAVGRKTKTTTAEGIATKYEYTAAGKVLSVTDNDQNKKIYTTNKDGDVVATQDFDGLVQSSGFDALHNMTTATDKQANVQSYSYNALGTLQKAVDAYGSQTLYNYDERGRLISTTDKNGNISTSQYDPNGRVVKKADPYNNAATFSYDNMGRIKTKTDPRQNTTSYSYDSVGRVSVITDPNGDMTKYAYDPNGNVTSVTDKRGNITQNYYDQENRLVKVKDANNVETYYTYDAAGKLTATKNGQNITTKSEYNKDGKTVTNVDGMGNTTTNVYNQMGRIKKTIYSDGSFNVYEYDAMGRQTRITNQLGYSQEFSYSPNGYLLSSKDAMGGIVTNTYDKLGRIATTTDQNGGIFSYAYDKMGNMTKKTDPEGNVSTFAYDKNNKKISATNAKGGTTLYTYDGTGNVQTITNPDGGRIVYTYDALNRVSNKVDAEGYITSYTYDKNGNIATKTDPRGGVTTYKYDALNQNIETIDPNNNSQKLVYDKIGRTIKVYDEENAETDYIYDDNSRVVRVVDAEFNTKMFEYDRMGRVTKSTDANGNSTLFDYDSVGNIVKQTDPDGHQTAYTYDKNGNKLTQTDLALSQTIRYSYDALNRVKTRTDAMFHVKSFEYDKNSRIKTVTDEMGNVTSYEYDPNGNMVKSTDPMGNAQTFVYNSQNKLVQMATNDGINATATTVYSYDKRGLKVSEINPAGYKKIIIYDENGNISQKTDEDGYTTTYQYDAVDMVKSINYAGGKQVLFRYNKAGFLVEMTDSNGTLTEQVDKIGRVTKTTDFMGNVVNFAYDPNGNKTKMTYPDGGEVGYTYDAKDRLTSVIEPDLARTDYSYDGAGRLIGKLTPDGERTTFGYNLNNQLIEVKEQNKASQTRRNYTYTYSDNGNLTDEYRSGVEIDSQIQQHQYFAYDKNGRMTKNATDDKQTTYIYDGLGNILTESKNGDVTAFSYNNLNQLTKKGNVSYEYDKRGNLVKKSDGSSYEYNYLGKMTKGTNERGETSEYTYDGFGNRVKTVQVAQNDNFGYRMSGIFSGSRLVGDINPIFDKNLFSQNTYTNEVGATKERQISTTTKFYTKDYTAQIERDIVVTEQGSHTAALVYGLDLLSQVTREVAVATRAGVRSEESGDRRTTGAGGDNIATRAAVEAGKIYYHTNLLGSKTYTTHADNTVASWQEYDVWGVPQAAGARSQDLGDRGTNGDLNLTAVAVRAQYTNHDYDVVLGMYYAKARMYDPVAHRFTGRDAARSGRNWYSYVSNNPATKKDPTGYAELVSDGEDPYYRASALGGVDEPYVPKPHVKPKPVTVVEEVDHGEVVQAEAVAPEPVVEGFGAIDWARIGYFAGGYGQKGYEIVRDFSPTMKMNDPKYLLEQLESSLNFYKSVGEFSQSLFNGNLSCTDVTDILGENVKSALVGDIMYVKDHAYQFDPNASVSNDESWELGRITAGAIYQLEQIGYTAYAFTTAAKKLLLQKQAAAAEAALAREGGAVAKTGGGKWKNADGTTKWPLNDGFEGTPTKTTLKSGTRIDRYGDEAGRFVSPEGTPFLQRSLPQGADAKNYTVYEVVNPIEVQAGKIAPWFDQAGGGTQYKLNLSIEKLIKAGDIKRLP